MAICRLGGQKVQWRREICSLSHRRDQRHPGLFLEAPAAKNETGAVSANREHRYKTTPAVHGAGGLVLHEPHPGGASACERLEGWRHAPSFGPWFETRRFAALLTMMFRRRTCSPAAAIPDSR